MQQSSRTKWRPAYLSRFSLGELEVRAAQLHEMLRECVVCPRRCGARRLFGRYGVCRSTNQIVISNAGPHFGEEPPLVGVHGSGTIFFSSCNLKCLFCQNYEISHLREGAGISTQQLARHMLKLQEIGCHNINLVTPTHFTPQIVEALVIAMQQGLSIPMVYNCGGYESVETLQLLENIIDIYMPDIKYSDYEHARKYSGAGDYWDIVQGAIKEMHRQVGDLVCNGNGVARRGLLIRHLVLPNRVAGSNRVLDFIAHEVSRNSYVNIMGQYRPCFWAFKMPELNCRPTSGEYDETISYARSIGLHRGFDSPVLQACQN